MWKIPLFDLDYDAREKDTVLEVLDSKWLSLGKKTEEFENSFSEYLGEGVFCLAVSSCSAALHMALLAHDIGPDDEVIISGLSFIASLNVVSIVGATPVLADSKSLEDWNVSSQDIKTKVTPKTKAIIIVHFAGYPCDMDEICKVAQENDLLLIEDVAHAVGAEYKSRKCGTFGDVACFSFFSNKNLSVGEGGMVVTSNRGLCDKFKLLRSHGMTSMTIDRHSGRSSSYDVVIPGLNYRIDEIRSALGIEQLKKLDESNERRKQIVVKYHSELPQVKGLVIPWNQSLEDRASSYHIFPLLLPKNVDRLIVMERMKEKGVQTSIHYPAYRDFVYYKDLIKDELKIAGEISKRVLTLPLYPSLAEQDVNYICDTIAEYFVRELVR